MEMISSLQDLISSALRDDLTCTLKPRGRLVIRPDGAQRSPLTIGDSGGWTALRELAENPRYDYKHTQQEKNKVAEA